MINTKYITIYTVPIIISIMYLLFLYYNSKINNKITEKKEYFKQFIVIYILTYIGITIFKNYASLSNNNINTEMYLGAPNF